MHVFLERIIPNETRSHDIESIKNDVLSRVEEDINKIKDEISEKLDTGIKNLLDLKSELGLAGNFGEQISNELKSSTRQKSVFMTLFISSLLAIPLFIVVTSVITQSFSLTETAEITIKASISITLLFMSYFFFSQYKLYQLISLKYTHLTGFLGGGATFIAQLIESENEELKVEVNRKLADLFMGQDDILGLIQKNRHPSEVSLEQANKIIQNVKAANK